MRAGARVAYESSIRTSVIRFSPSPPLPPPAWRISARMVSLARRRHPDARFERAGFFEFVAGREEAAWDTILFVAALQFFPDVDAVLAACAARLAPGGRVVVAHVRGAAFVREERRGNPAVVEALPAVEDLLAAGGFGLVHAEEDLDDFYLVVLERA